MPSASAVSRATATVLLHSGAATSARYVERTVFSARLEIPETTLCVRVVEGAVVAAAAIRSPGREAAPATPTVVLPESAVSPSDQSPAPSISASVRTRLTLVSLAHDGVDEPQRRDAPAERDLDRQPVGRVDIARRR